MDRTGTDPNIAVYRSAGVVSGYAAADGLHEAERRALARIGTELAVGRLLDIGIGGGRTVRPLSSLAAFYVGIDYALEMVEAARRRFPGVRLEHVDARDLSAFGDASFDVVIFSFNGIDYVDDEDRRRILGEVRRVLVPGGWFVFSSHNREHDRFGLLPWQRRLRIGRRTIRASLKVLPHLRTHRRMRRSEVHREGYAIVNDEAHGFSLLTYYIAPGHQVAQLGRAGFEDVTVLDTLGQEVSTGAGPSISLYYLAR